MKAGTTESSVLEKLRKICSRLPETSETVTFGHPTFQVRGKTFAVLEEYKAVLGIALKVEKSIQGLFLKDKRFFLTPYAGKHGWVTLKIHAAPLDWKEVAELVKGSYLLVGAAPQKHKATKKPAATGRTTG